MTKFCFHIVLINKRILVSMHSTVLNYTVSVCIYLFYLCSDFLLHYIIIILDRSNEL